MGTRNLIGNMRAFYYFVSAVFFDFGAAVHGCHCQSLSHLLEAQPSDSTPWCGVGTGGTINLTQGTQMFVQLLQGDVLCVGNSVLSFLGTRTQPLTENH